MKHLPPREPPGENPNPAKSLGVSAIEDASVATATAAVPELSGIRRIGGGRTLGFHWVIFATVAVLAVLVGLAHVMSAASAPRQQTTSSQSP